MAGRASRSADAGAARAWRARWRGSPRSRPASSSSPRRATPRASGRSRWRRATRGSRRSRRNTRRARGGRFRGSARSRRAGPRASARLTQEVQAFEERIAIVEHERTRAKLPDSVGAVAPWVFEIYGPILSHGTVSWSGSDLVATGTMARGIDPIRLGTFARGRYEIASVSPPTASVRRQASP